MDLELRSSRSESNRPLRATCTKTAAHTWHAEAIWTLLLFWPTVASSGWLDADLDERSFKPLSVTNNSVVCERPLRAAWVLLLWSTWLAADVRKPTLLFLTERGFSLLSKESSDWIISLENHPWVNRNSYTFFSGTRNALNSGVN